MSNHPRPLLRLKKHELLPPDEDRKMEVGVYDALLPCRKYEVAYKVPEYLYYHHRYRVRPSEGQRDLSGRNVVRAGHCSGRAVLGLGRR